MDQELTIERKLRELHVKLDEILRIQRETCSVCKGTGQYSSFKDGGFVTCPCREGEGS